MNLKRRQEKTMARYVYRVDTRVGIDSIKDGVFRAKRWGSSFGSSYPHEELLRIKLTPGEGLFIICFYTSLQKAESAQKMDFDWLGPSEILRCDKQCLIDVGFTETWDDGFIQGDAYLFWVRERVPVADQRLSSTGVPLAQFEIFRRGAWSKLEDYIWQTTALDFPSGSPAISSEARGQRRKGARRHC
jgi:hypothetical protein